MKMANKQKFTHEKPKIAASLNFASREAYNVLRANLMFSFSDSPNGKIIGLTSPCPSEGKSTTAINLAFSLAEAGYKTLLIDADMRCQSVASAIGVSPAPGLSNLLVNNEKNVIRKGVLTENLSVITAGDVPPNPSELLGSENMRAVLDLFKDHFDYILIDLPPVNVVSDPLVVSKHLDGMIVVVLHRYSKKQDINAAIRQLKMTGVRILGFVYNGYSPDGAVERSRRYNRGYYGYGDAYNRSFDRQRQKSDGDKSEN